MPDTTHSPTPWKIGGDDNTDGIPDIEINIADGPYKDICRVQSTLVGESHWHLTTEDRENAAFIVRAVNAHDDLVAALRECLPYVARYEAAHESNAALDALTAANAALTKAGA